MDDSASALIGENVPASLRKRLLESYERHRSEIEEADQHPDDKPSTQLYVATTESRAERIVHWSFVEMAGRLAAADKMDQYATKADIIGEMCGVRGCLAITDVGAEYAHRKSFYQMLLGIIEQRRILGRPTTVTTSRPDSWELLRPHMDRQGEPDLIDRILTAIDA